MSHLTKQLVAGLLFFGLIGCEFEAAESNKLFVEKDLDFTNELIASKDLNILSYLYYYNGAGVAAADFNNDGLDDIYLTGNQCPDALLINKGNLQFENATINSGISNKDGWTTGVTYADINGDGLRDIYVCKVGHFKNITGRNLLYLNSGNDSNGYPVFKESAHEFGLDIESFGTQAAFFDYDLDGDLDMYLLNHSVYPNRSYGRGAERNAIDSLSGDRFFENVNGRFSDVTSVANIFQGKIGYGLGISIVDYNKDGFPDIYVGNDFFENDYLYLNNGDKTFSEMISNHPGKIGHTSHYSMGNASADWNNDGYADIMSLDMLPENLKTFKTSGAEDAFPIYNRFLANNYSPQFMQNVMLLNRGGDYFSEVAYQMGISATEWSWGVLPADFDGDGYKDLYISNGIPGATNDMDYIKFMVQDHVQGEIENGNNDESMKFISKIPEKKVPNYFFRNRGNLEFEDVTETWSKKNPTFSHGTALADFDNDGDLDIVVNHLNQKAQVLENKSAPKSYLKVSFSGPEMNTYGIGTKVEVFAGELYIYEENFPVKSYLSTSVDYLLFGLGKNETIDSIKVTWPDGKQQRIQSVQVNQVLNISYSDAQKSEIIFDPEVSQISIVTGPFGSKHIENTSLDFDRDPLVPFALSNEGPSILVADFNGDGLEDYVMTGGKNQMSELWVQSNQGFERQSLMGDKDYHISEDVSAIALDGDLDGDLDLIIGSAGNEFQSGKPLKPRYYENTDGTLTHVEHAFGELESHISKIKKNDFDKDGDDDIIFLSNNISQLFGEPGLSYLFRNNDGKFENVTSEVFSESDFRGFNDAEIVDLDGNGFDDIVTVGDWQSIRIFYNEQGVFRKKQLDNTEGWWNCIVKSDVDGDGDLDFVCGNWGLNTRLKASVENPIRLYRYDFDKNGKIEPIVTYYYQGAETVFATKDDLVKQLPFLNKRFLSYSAFADATVEDLFSKEKLQNADQYKVIELRSSIMMNLGNGQFELRPLPSLAQISSVNDIQVSDFNDDGFDDLLLVGNNYEISTQLGRLDASHGLLLINDRKGYYHQETIQHFDISGPARCIESILIGGAPYFIVGINNDYPVLVKRQSN